MTAYKNFVQDFPSRSLELLESFSPQAERKKREVTLLLSLATTCLVVPYERLRKDDQHPSRDSERFEQAAAQLANELDKACDSSCLWTAEDLADWRHAKVKTVHGAPDAWSVAGSEKPLNKKKARTVVHILRNALAHGNIWTCSNPIESCVFVARASYKDPKAGFNFVRCTPSALEAFLRCWVELLRGLDIPGDQFIESGIYSDEAAA